MSHYASFVDANGRFVSSHFKHRSNTSESGGDGCPGGESDPHIRMKEIAQHRLEWDFDGEFTDTFPDTTFIGENMPDAGIRFDGPRRPWGKGILVEVQFKNKGKDKESTTQNYLNEGYSVCWLTESDFDNRSVDILSHDDLSPLWPFGVPEKQFWADQGRTSRDYVRGALSETQRKVPATWYTSWYPDNRFPPWIRNRLTTTDDDRIMTTEAVRRRTWSTLFPDGVADWDETPYYPGECNVADALQNESTEHIAGTSPRYFLARWLADIGEGLWSRTTQGLNTVLVPASIAETVIETAGPLDIGIDFDHPPGPFEDVQCWSCRAYWHVNSQQDECGKCGVPIDWEWNLATGRISQDKLPDE